MYYYGGGSCGCGMPFQTFPTWGWNNGWGNSGWGNSGSNYAIILVLFILLVIVIGSRITS